MTTPLLHVEHLDVIYPGSRRGLRREPMRAVNDVSFDVSAGETLGLVGESGAGKSTVGRAILGLIRPTGGRVLIDGKDVARGGRHYTLAQRAVAQVVFQDPTASLNPARTIGDTLGEPLRIHRRLRRGASRRAAMSLCQQVSLSPDMVSRLPSALSGGQRQRAAIARALAPEPRLIVCDEPVTALDVSTQAQVVNLLADLQDQTGVALLFISHDLSVVRHLAQRTGVMYAGNLVETGPTNLVCGAPAHPYTHALLASVPVADPIRQRRRRQERQDAAASTEPAQSRRIDVGCPYAPRCPRATDICRATAPPLVPFGDGRSVACYHPLTNTSPAGAKGQAVMAVDEQPP